LSPVQASSPGKLILAGEYAVLGGAPGLVMAVNRRARVSLEASPDTRWHLLSIQENERETQYSLDARGQPEWDTQADRDDFTLVDTILRHLDELGLGRLPPFRLILDTSEFFDRAGGHKLGLGSSAAVTVALVDALDRWTGKVALDPQQQLARLLLMHRQFQGDRGSGIDLAASLQGGVLEFRRPPGNLQASLHAGALPRGVHFSVAWSGKPASTPALVRTLEQAAAADPAKWKPISDQLLGGFRAADARSFLEAIADYGQRLLHLQEFSGIPIYTAEHIQLRQVASGLGLVYKPSGAGGGDLGLALGTDPEALAQFCDQVRLLGLYCPDIRLENEGLLHRD
jgi:phosphomevalonate kinase